MNGSDDDDDDDDGDGRDTMMMSDGEVVTMKVNYLYI